MVTKLVNSDTFLLSVLPLYILVILLAHIFSCIWYYIADSASPDSWINRSGYRSESLHDRYWAALYFIYTTLTTTGYGDIVPYTFTEMLATVLFTGVGVTVHSVIYTSMLQKFDELSQKHEEFGVKKELMKEF